MSNREYFDIVVANLIGNDIRVANVHELASTFNPPDPPDQWLIRQCFHLITYRLKNPPGRHRIITLDELADFNKIGDRTAGPPNAHQ
jgi:hypothetical protein